jgi:undecaprenyl pyrophosphate phosphatase UppP
MLWAVHFLAVYVATALACVLGLGAAGAGARSGFVATLALVTVAAAAAALLHAAWRYRQQRAVPDLQFRMAVTIGCDAIASVAIIWQLFPILLVPPCV